MAGDINDLTSGLDTVNSKVDKILEYLGTIPEDDKKERPNLSSMFERKENEEKRERNKFTRYYRKQRMYQAVPIVLDGISEESSNELTKIFKNLIPEQKPIKTKPPEQKFSWGKLLSSAFEALAPLLADILPVLAGIGAALVLFNTNIQDFIANIAAWMKNLAPKPAADAAEAAAALTKAADKQMAAAAPLSKAAEKTASKVVNAASTGVNAAATGDALVNDILKLLTPAERALMKEKLPKIRANILTEILNSFSIDNIINGIKDIIKNDILTPQEYEKIIKPIGDFLKEIPNAFKTGPEDIVNGIKDIIKNDIFTPQEYEKIIKPIGEFFSNIFAKVGTVWQDTNLIAKGSELLRAALASSVGQFISKAIPWFGSTLSLLVNSDWANKELQKPDADTKAIWTTAIATSMINIAGWFGKNLWGFLATWLKADDLQTTVKGILNTASTTELISRMIVAPLDIFVKGAGEMCAVIFGDLLGYISKKVFKSEFWTTYFDEATKEFRQNIKDYNLVNWVLEMLGIQKKEKQEEKKPEDAKQNANKSGKSHNDFVMRPGFDAVSFSPNDTIIGVKDLNTLTKPTQDRMLAHYDKSLKTLVEAMDKSNKNVQRDNAQHTQKLTESFKVLSDTLIAKASQGVNMVNNSRNQTNISITPTTSVNYRETRLVFA
jgi:hypothetical protein